MAHAAGARICRRRCLCGADSLTHRVRLHAMRGLLGGGSSLASTAQHPQSRTSSVRERKIWGKLHSLKGTTESLARRNAPTPEVPVSQTRATLRSAPNDAPRENRRPVTYRTPPRSRPFAAIARTRTYTYIRRRARPTDGVDCLRPRAWERSSNRRKPTECAP